MLTVLSESRYHVGQFPTPSCALPTTEDVSKTATSSRQTLLALLIVSSPLVLRGPHGTGLIRSQSERPHIRTTRVPDIQLGAPELAQ